MYLSSFIHQNTEKYGFLSNDKNSIFDLKKAEKALFDHQTLPDSLNEAITKAKMQDRLNEVYTKTLEKIEDVEPIPVSEIEYIAPIPKPNRNIFCLGVNYKEHAYEFRKTKDDSKAIPTHPIVFSKLPTTVIGPSGEIKSHKSVTKELDYEAELAIIIGKKGSYIPKEKAYDYIYGYTIINDITARDLQRDHKQWLLGKGLDTFAPMGPYIATTEEIPDSGKLNIECRVNGETRQKSNTELLIFDIPTIIHTLSQGITLEPGDIIATGTPKGVGMGFEPPKFLEPGDEVEVEIEGLHVLKNKVI